MDREQGSTRTAGIQVIQRAASILRVLRDAEDGLSLGQISQEVGLARSTVQRIVWTLQQEGWVAAATPNARVRLGPGLADLATAAGKGDHTRIVRPLLERLSRQLEETVDLAILEQDHVLLVDQVTAAAQWAPGTADIGATSPVHCTANGKALLAGLPPERVRDLLPETLLRMTPRTVATRAELMTELDDVRMVGIAFDLEEHETGVCALARTVTAPDGWTAAVTVTVSAERLYGSERRLVSALDAACAGIETALGA